MSDPVSNVEIEDVLSSIRRLVTDGEWGQTPNPAAKQENEPKAEAPSKFVLTPALRVVEQDEQDTSQDHSSESEEPQVEDHQDAEEFTPSEHVNEEAHSADQTDEHAEEETDQEASQTPSIEAVIADLEAAVDAHAHEWEDVIEEGGESDDDFETEEDVTFQHTDMSSEPEADEHKPADQAFSAELDEDLSAYMDEDNVIDEDALRKLVAEVIRQELQGALGERITRNVRKLVRREIYRILASEDFN